MKHPDLTNPEFTAYRASLIETLERQLASSQTAAPESREALGKLIDFVKASPENTLAYVGSVSLLCALHESFLVDLLLAPAVMTRFAEIAAKARDLVEEHLTEHPEDQPDFMGTPGPHGKSKIKYDS